MKKYDGNGLLKFEFEYSQGITKKGKEYINGKLRYDGELSFRVRHGKGKEYDFNGNLIFDGEYIEGEKQNGILKEYDFNNNKLILDGELLNGKIWNCKKYDKNGNLICELINGKGIMKKFDYFGNLIQEGEYIDGELKKGKEFYGQNEVIFEGEYSNEKRWKGTGKEYNNIGQLLFEGEYLNGIKWKGIAKVFYENHKINFEGEYIDGQLSGKAKEYYDNGSIKFEGEYLNGKRWNGRNFYFYGGEYEAEIKNGNRMGYLKIIHNNGNTFIGEYNIHTENRKGKEFNPQGKLLFEGEYINNIPIKGYKKEYNDEGELIFEGEYLRGKRNGKGKEYNNGKIIFEGEYINGERKKKD